jgi:hypothetical protein
MQKQANDKVRQSASLLAELAINETQARARLSPYKQSGAGARFQGSPQRTGRPPQCSPPANALIGRSKTAVNARN